MSSDGAVTFVRATVRDAEAVRELVRRAYARWIPVIGREPVPMTVDYVEAIRRHQIDLAYAGSDLVGLVETIACPDHIFIENIAVDVDRQGRGLGRRLLRHAEDEARSRSLPQTRLLTNEAFESNLRLYRSEGYRIEGREPFQGGTTVFFSKDLSD